MSASETSDLFREGWLDEHLSRVVAELRERPEHLRPRLTGDRSWVHGEPLWLRESDGEVPR